ncbi:MAG: HAMP domain-containing histidine kinase [Deltaproteobacteria bacterium]|nr:HAMP domain-containing histidine kinase [Deltaproteobacteria bacterium]
MRLTLFSRLIAGHLALCLLVLAASAYAYIQLRRFNDVTRSVLEVDNLILDYEQKLSDILLSQIRYEKKFVITKDNSLYEQFLLFKSDFDQYLDQALRVADSRSKELLSSVRGHYQTYQETFGSEMKYLAAGQSYPQSRYTKEKEVAVNAIFRELERLRTYGHMNTYSKIKGLSEAATDAGQVALIITVGSLILGLAISFVITRTMTRPVSLLKSKTREIARGDFTDDLKLSSPPEMAELASAFNFMCGKLKELDRMKSEFFSTMSHDLRTPLTSIKEGTGLLLDGNAGPTTEKQRKVLAILAEESGRLIHLVNSLLDLSKMEAGMMVYRFEPTNLTPLIQRVMTEIMPLVEAQRVSLEAKIHPNLPLIKADSERLLQALRNLLGNAVKFTPPGGQVTISADQRDGKVEVSVLDTGPGIPPEHLSSIFEKYHQASPRGLQAIKGTGLGLAIVKHIITSHGGKVWAESQPSKGSTFTFVLPS